MNAFLKNALLKLLRPKVVRNYRKYCRRKIGHALLYYKTDPFVASFVAREYTHTNNWEILEMTRILNRLGFWVDVYGREITSKDVEQIKDKYDIFIGIGAGNSGKHYADIAQKLSRAKKILLALGPEPQKSNELIKERYDYFFKRHPKASVTVRRMITEVDMEEAARHTDAFFLGGSTFTKDTYAKFRKPFYKFYCSSSPEIEASYDQFLRRDRRKFVYFGGNGNIVKGLDIVIDAFLGLPELELYICAPDWEKDFNQVYRESLKNAKNIHFLGFIRVAGKTFNKITSESGSVIFLSCSEGAANSVVACMKRGLVPIVNYASGIDDVEKFGILVDEVSVENVRKMALEASQMSEEAFLQKSLLSYFRSFEYSQARFSENFERALLEVLSGMKNPS
jgi:hypothetical protein